MSDPLPEESLGALLRQRHLTLALAESCTGGLIAHRVTNVAGSSAYFLGGLVSYANDAKERLLGVPTAILMAYGAVSDPTARAMARGARSTFRADLALAVTGIAGPGGGTTDKPVGLTYIALVAPDGEWVESHVWPGDRLAVKTNSADAAFSLAIRYLRGELT